MPAKGVLIIMINAFPCLSARQGPLFHPLDDAFVENNWRVVQYIQDIYSPTNLYFHIQDVATMIGKVTIITCQRRARGESLGIL